jgi:uncharacterized protein
MIYLLSPAKTLDYESPILPAHQLEPTLPRFPRETLGLNKILRKLKPDDLSQLMDISAALAELNHGRFKQFSKDFTPTNSRAALLAFNGDVYDGLKARTLGQADLLWSQDHVRMLSGLYGLLRPLDLMQPYRLEMGTRLETKLGKNLYAFWGKKIAKALNDDLTSINASLVVNLASEEYFGSVALDRLKARVIQPVFQERKISAGPDAPFKVVSFNAKRARGLMVRYAIDARLENELALKDFSLEGYAFHSAASSESQWIYRREV